MLQVYLNKMFGLQQNEPRLSPAQFSLDSA